MPLLALLVAVSAARLDACYAVADRYYWKDDKPAALAWLKHGAEAGSAACQNRYGELLRRTDPDAAMAWIRKAVAQGYLEAYVNTGDLELTKQAAEQYCPTAYQALMHLYEDREAWEEAYFWGLVALYGGDSELIPARAQVARDRRQAIQKRADSWLKQRQTRWDATIDGPSPDP